MNVLGDIHSIILDSKSLSQCKTMASFSIGLKGHKKGGRGRNMI